MAWENIIMFLMNTTEVWQFRQVETERGKRENRNKNVLINLENSGVEILPRTPKLQNGKNTLLQVQLHARFGHSTVTQWFIDLFNNKVDVTIKIKSKFNLKNETMFWIPIAENLL